ncbi:MAG: DMT family transporter [Rhodospirillales bacterium]|nr:DMT family transporter [Rhodospirillales bacterium]MCB9996328.1 DMT family transporter [Rhodospirillales bacterium]
MKNSAAPSQHPVVTGMMLYGAAVFLIVVMNSFAKLVSEEHHPVEIVFYRNLVIMAGLLAYLGVKKDWQVLKTQRPGAHIFRGLVGTLSVTLVFYAYKYLPVANATVLINTSPLIVAALSVPILKEQVGLFRWSAILAGFIGVLIIVQPGSGGNLTGYLFAISAAITVATVSIYLRDLGKTENPMTTVFYFILIGTIATGLFMPFIGNLPSFHAVAILTVVGIAGAAQQFMKTHAMTMAPAATLSPLQYTGIIWGIVFGWVLFSDWPGLPFWIGGTIIVASNLLIWAREKRRKAQNLP